MSNSSMNTKMIEFCRAWHGLYHINVGDWSHTSQWHIARLPPNYAKKCWAMQANTWTLCNAKVRTNKHGIPTSTYKGTKKYNCSTNNVEYQFGLCLDNIKCCVNGKEYYLLVGGFFTITTLLIPRSHFCVPLNLDARSTSRFGKSALQSNNAECKLQKQIGECGTYEQLLRGGVSAILCPWFGVIINIVSKEDIAYHVTIGDIPHCTCLDFTKMSSKSLCKKMKWVHCKHLHYVFRFMCKVDYDSDKFNHASTYTFNEVIWLLELVDVVECE